MFFIIGSVVVIGIVFLIGLKTLMVFEKMCYGSSGKSFQLGNFGSVVLSLIIGGVVCAGFAFILHTILPIT